MKLILAAFPALCLALAGASAFAQEAIATANGAAPAAAVAATQETDDAWAKRTLDAAAAKADAKAPAARSCGAAQNGGKYTDGQPADNKPHGEVWAGVGTHGYREEGGVVTQPLGPCATLTLGIDHTEFGGGNRGGRPR